jgi:Flp pilus assembly protein TadD
LLSELLLRTAQYQEVKTVAEQCLRDPALKVEGYLIRGRLAMANGDAAGARTEFERAIVAAPGDRVALEARCQLLFENGHPSEAEAALRTLIDCQPEDAFAYHNLGMLMLRSRRNDEAAQSFRQSLRHRADASATYLHLGFALKESGRLEEAVSAWQQVLRLGPHDLAAREELKQAGHFGNGAADRLNLV